MLKIKYYRKFNVYLCLYLNSSPKLTRTVSRKTLNQPGNRNKEGGNFIQSPLGRSSSHTAGSERGSSGGSWFRWLQTERALTSITSTSARERETQWSEREIQAKARSQRASAASDSYPVSFGNQWVVCVGSGRTAASAVRWWRVPNALLVHRECTKCTPVYVLVKKSCCEWAKSDCIMKSSSGSLHWIPWTPSGGWSGAPELCPER